MAAENFPINVAASVIADISAGIYRTPAGALKELISNAFDADAGSVRISTGDPHFRTFTCTDDGSGMTPGRFKEIMGLIGGSSKRDSSQYSEIYRRPLVGRIGIGLLSIGQICRRFEVFSSARGSDRKFRARVNLEPYTRPEARRIQLGTQLAKDPKVKVGDAEIEEAPESAEKHYTRIVMEDIIPGFAEQLQSEPMAVIGVTPQSFKKGDMRAFLASVSTDQVARHGAYAQLIWELAITAPIQYLPEGPIRSCPQLDDLRQRMEGFKFRVYLDGVELFKPTLLPPNLSTAHKVYPRLDYEKVLGDGRMLSVRGYIYWQKTRILPRELQGVLVRVRNVGIGACDPTYLGYPRHEGWKFSQMFGELYVDEGLDEAINIDRGSFRETDEAYLALQEFLFQRLGKETDEGAGIFSSIKAATSEIAHRRKAKETAGRLQRTAAVIYGKPRPVTITETEPREAAPSGVKVTSSEVRVDGELLRAVPAKYRDLFMGVCAVLEKKLPACVPATRRRDILRKLADLFAAQ